MCLEKGHRQCAIESVHIFSNGSYLVFRCVMYCSSVSMFTKMCSVMIHVNALSFRTRLTPIGDYGRRVH